MKKLILALSLLIGTLTFAPPAMAEETEAAKADKAQAEALRAAIDAHLSKVRAKALSGGKLEKKEKPVVAPIPGDAKIKSNSKAKTYFYHEIG